MRLVPSLRCKYDDDQRFTQVALQLLSLHAMNDPDDDDDDDNENKTTDTILMSVLITSQERQDFWEGLHCRLNRSSSLSSMVQSTAEIFGASLSRLVHAEQECSATSMNSSIDIGDEELLTGLPPTTPRHTRSKNNYGDKKRRGFFFGVEDHPSGLLVQQVHCLSLDGVQTVTCHQPYKPPTSSHIVNL